MEFSALDSLNFAGTREARRGSKQDFYQRVGAQTAKLEIEHTKSRAEAAACWIRRVGAETRGGDISTRHGAALKPFPAIRVNDASTVYGNEVRMQLSEESRQSNRSLRGVGTAAPCLRVVGEATGKQQLRVASRVCSGHREACIRGREDIGGSTLRGVDRGIHSDSHCYLRSSLFSLSSLSLSLLSLLLVDSRLLFHLSLCWSSFSFLFTSRLFLFFLFCSCFVNTLVCLCLLLIPSTSALFYYFPSKFGHTMFSYWLQLLVTYLTLYVPLVLVSHY